VVQQCGDTLVQQEILTEAQVGMKYNLLAPWEVLRGGKSRTSVWYIRFWRLVHLREDILQNIACNLARSEKSCDLGAYLHSRVAGYM
jgi:hypothetical protein